MYAGALWRYRAKITSEKLLVASSSAGKTVLLINMISDIYKGCFGRIYLWSPSVDVDNAWKPVKDYIHNTIKPNDREK